MVSTGRFELPTYRLGGDCSILLSYVDIIYIYHTTIFLIFQEIVEKILTIGKLLSVF